MFTKYIGSYVYLLNEIPDTVLNSGSLPAKSISLINNDWKMFFIFFFLQKSLVGSGQVKVMKLIDVINFSGASHLYTFTTTYLLCVVYIDFNRL